MKERPHISIVIPCRNEKSHIGMCLDSLLNQEYSGPYEILVADGLSNDGTREIISAYSGQDERVRLISNPERITPAALNYGVTNAKGEIILIFGAHWYVNTNFLSEIERLFREYPVDCMGGRIIREANSELTSLIEIARGSLLGGGLSCRNNSNVKEQIIQEANIAYIYRRQVFETVGLFDNRFVKNQDNEFNLRTILAGFKTLFAPSIVFHYYAPDSFKKLFWQMYNYASFTPMMSVKHHKLLRAHFAMPAFALVIWLISIVLGLTSIIPNILPVILIGLYSLMSVFGSLIIGMKAGQFRKWHIIFRAIFTIHFAVMFGYLNGIYKLFNAETTISLWKTPRPEERPVQ